MILIIEVIDKLFLIYMLMIFARIVGSWFPEFQSSSIMRFVAYYTDPYLNIFKRVIPPLGMLDFSPMVAIFALYFIEWIVKAIFIKLLV